MIRHGASRRGSLLVIVAGLCALLAAMTLAFIARTRSDGEEAHELAQEIQARVMLSAGLMYVQETARLGWRDETFGWRDVRDGRAGPRGYDGDWPAPLKPLLDDSGHGPRGAAFPAIGGRAARDPMYVMARPPFAIKATATPNPIPLTDPDDLAALSLPWDKLVNYAVPDPQPVAATRAEFDAGDPEPRRTGGIPSWFRVYRSGVDTFVVTCGAGASLGYRDWAEVVADGAAASFGSSDDFALIRADETILWYEAQWSEMVTGNNFFNTHYGRFNPRPIGTCDEDGAESPNMRQFAGTFTYIERLDQEPRDW